MALQANTVKLHERVRERLDAHTYESYLAELQVVEASTDRIVLRVGPTLAREASRRCGPALVGACRQLFGSRRVLLAGDEECLDLGEGRVCRTEDLAGEGSTRHTGRPRSPGHMRQRRGLCGQPGTRQRLEAQKSFRVPFALAASLPRTASQAFGRHSADEPLEYVGRWGAAYSEETLTPFHHGCCSARCGWRRRAA